MGAYPAVQAHLREILTTQFPSDEDPSLDEILGTKIPYLDCVCEETARLASPVKAQLRQALVDTEVLGYHIPKGAQVFMNLHLNRPPVPFDELRRHASSQEVAKKTGYGLQGEAGRNLDSFEPGRWLVTDSKTGKEAYNASAIPMNAFGGGYRGCAGKPNLNHQLQHREHLNQDGCHPAQRLELTNRLYRTEFCNDGDSHHGRFANPEL